MGHIAGRLYRPQPLAPTTTVLNGTDRFVALFGNSRFEAGIDGDRLATGLGSAGRVKVQSWSGGGWDALHYYQLALLNRDVLRPERDVVLIETSVLSADDSAPGNRLGVIRPEVARQVITLPGMPLETRLDLLVGAAVGLYRYRTSVQAELILPSLDRAATGLARPMERVRLVGDPRQAPEFELVTAPGRGFVVESVKGDAAALRARSRVSRTSFVRDLRFGFKLEALQRAVRALRSRGIKVFLVEMPLSRWLSSQIAASAGGQKFAATMKSLAAETGAVVLDAWPESLHDDERFFDDEHMLASATAPFTDALRNAINAELAARP